MARRYFEVELAGKMEKIEELPTKKNEAFREYVFTTDLSAFFKAYQSFTAMDLKNEDNPTEKLLPIVQIIFQQAPKLIREMINKYAPKISIDYLENEVYEPELIDAFIAIVRLAFPFESLLDQVKKMSLTRGLFQTPILKSSPWPNGESKTQIPISSHSSENTLNHTSDEKDLNLSS